MLVVGGAPGLGGAAHLAARAALRAGAGLVTAAAPGAGIADIKNGWPEIMTLPLGESERQWPARLPQNFMELAQRCAALVVGSGMISTSEIKITILIQEKYVELAVRILHDTFGLDWDLG